MNNYFIIVHFFCPFWPVFTRVRKSFHKQKRDKKSGLWQPLCRLSSGLWSREKIETKLVEDVICIFRSARRPQLAGPGTISLFPHQRLSNRCKLGNNSVEHYKLLTHNTLLGILPEPKYPAGAAPGDGGQVRDREDLHLHSPHWGALHREVHQQYRQLLRQDKRELHPR